MQLLGRCLRLPSPMVAAATNHCVFGQARVSTPITIERLVAVQPWNRREKAARHKNAPISAFPGLKHSFEFHPAV